MDPSSVFRYHGRSMWPLFQERDLLLLECVGTDELQAGDCIVYRRDAEDQQIIHRIVSADPFILTQGDARPCMDDEPVAPEWVIGRVTTRMRHGQASRVHRGLAGLLQKRVCRLGGRLDPSRMSRGGSIARLLQCMLGRITHRWVRRAKVSSYASLGGLARCYLVWGKQVVAQYDQRGKRWMVFWPHSLWIDPAQLPSPVARGA